MKSTKAFVFQMILVMLLFPAVLLPVSQISMAERNVVQAEFTPQSEGHSVLVRWGGQVHEMDLEDYVVGVVLAEMPAYFEPEALKAQAAVSRTFAWKATLTGGKHGDHSVCTDSSCCQGYITEEKYVRYFGTQQDVEKIKNAVADTAETVITYGNDLIEATYFSSSGGLTEDAVSVWGNAYPYLTCKESPEPDSQGEATAAFSRAYLEEALHIRLEGSPVEWFHDWERTQSGGVARVGIGSRIFTGTELRKILSLRSTLFTVSVKNDVVFFHTKGQGHRVGMSQFGAETMAVDGASWEEILQYYYAGIGLEKISQLQQDFTSTVEQ